MPWPKGKTHPSARLNDRDFIAMYEDLARGPAYIARTTKTALSSVKRRRQHLEQKLGRAIQAKGPWAKPRGEFGAALAPGRIQLKLYDGVVLVASDAHYWPGDISTAHRAFVRFCRRMRPKIVVMNGDVLDGSTISRHAPIGWESRPSLIQEIEACQERLGEIVKASPGAQYVWPLGNHDARFESRIAAVAPEYAKVKGVHLSDHFGAEWQPCWSCFVNDDVVVKHRFKSGIHAPHNNTMWAGRSIVTGHLHSLKVQPISDYNGTRWGVDTGTLADPYGKQFSDYTEDNPRSWRSGFAILTFKDGRLLWPEVCHVVEPGVVDFRGQLIEV